MKILFVDDEPTLSEALQAKMEARGFQCVSRNDMTSALAYMQEEAVAAVVTDIMMPAGDDFPSIDSSETGFFFVKKLRKEFPGVGVVCLSVIGDQRKINELKKLNVLYLGKATRSRDCSEAYRIQGDGIIPPRIMNWEKQRIGN